ncbi:MAG TPA: hypothetical protein VMV94_05990 [Phycisphaerae bacterium]|nr:hypothetical protein [Phycisphaerae bacterium]
MPVAPLWFLFLSQPSARLLRRNLEVLWNYLDREDPWKNHAHKKHSLHFVAGVIANCANQIKNASSQSKADQRSSGVSERQGPSPLKPENVDKANKHAQGEAKGGTSEDSQKEPNDRVNEEEYYTHYHITFRFS